MTRRLLTLILVAAAVPLLVTAQRRPARPTAPATVDVPVTELVRDSAGNIVFNREVYSYPRGARRDPFQSLILSGDIRPLLADLEVGGIIYDPTGRNSIAVLKDISTGEVYRARVGSVFGRLRITAIRQREVAVAIDEFGFTRQEILSTNAPRGARTP